MQNSGLILQSNNIESLLRDSVQRTKQKLVNIKDSIDLEQKQTYNTFGKSNKSISNQSRQHKSSMSKHKNSLQQKKDKQIEILKQKISEYSEIDRLASYESERYKNIQNELELAKQKNRSYQNETIKLKQQLAQIKRHQQQEISRLKSELTDQKLMHKTQIQQLKKQLEQRRRISDKYHQELQIIQQQKRQSDNYNRRLANQYTLLLENQNKNQQEEKSLHKQYQQKINILNKQIKNLKILLSKASDRQYTATKSDKDQEKIEKNLKSIKQNHLLKIQNQQLKSNLILLSKQYKYLKKEENLTQRKLAINERNTQAIMQQAAKSGIMVSQRMLQKMSSKQKKRRSNIGSVKSFKYLNQKENICNNKKSKKNLCLF